MKRVVLTGGTGFVGANLARRLLALGHQVHLLVRPGFQPWRIEAIRDAVQLHPIGLNDPEALRRLLGEVRPEWIFHLAAYGACSHQKDFAAMLRTNVEGTANLVQAALETGCEALVNTGTSLEYGAADHPPAEDEALAPNSHYAVAKAAATMLCRFLARQHKMNISTLRLYSVYGPWEAPERLFPTLIGHALRGELPPLVSPETAHDFVYVDDVAAAYILAAGARDQEPGAVYNVGSGRQTTMRELVQLARTVFGLTIEPQWGSMPDRHWDTQCWIADRRKIQAALGWAPQVTLEEGLRQTADWLRAQPPGDLP